jgi:hypothetical protein
MPQMGVGSLVSVSLCAHLWMIMSADAADFRRWVLSLVSVLFCAYLWMIMSADAADYRRWV